MMAAVLYILAGVRLAPFHADEADHLFKARDYVVYFVLGRPDALAVHPPVAIDSESHIRLLTGNVNAYLSGFLLYHTGQPLITWPAAWYYPQSPAENRAAGRWPDESVLWRGRLASAWMTCIAAGLMYAIGTHLAGRRAGLICMSLFTLHPVILLNGRRGLQEGALMAGSLLLVWLALRIHSGWGWWGLGIAAGLALAGKLTALLTVAGVLAGTKGRFYHYAVFGVAACLAYGLLTPAIWPNPLARLRLTAELRAEVLQGQTRASEFAHRSPFKRLTALLTQPFPQRLQYSESPAFLGDVGLEAEIRRYEHSHLRGWTFPWPLGMALAMMGAWSVIRRNQRVMMAWGLVVGGGTLVSVPLAWERYYLPWTLVVVLLAGLGLESIYRKWFFRI